MRLEFRLTQDDVYEAIANHPASSVLQDNPSQDEVRRRARIRKLLRIICWLTIILLAVQVVNFLQQHPGIDIQPPKVLFAIVPWLFLIGALLFFLRALRQRRRLFQAQVWTVEPDSITVKTKRPWSEWSSWQETPNLFILRLPDKSIVILPKRSATDAEVEELRRIFSQNLPMTAMGFAVVGVAASGDS